MSHQYELDFAELANLLPQPIPIRHIKEIPSKLTCFVGICGFETRCYAAAQALAMNSFKYEKTICAHYSQDEMKVANDANREEMHKAIKSISSGTEPILLPYDSHDMQVDFGDKLLNLLRHEGVNLESPNTHVTFDITVGNSRLLIEGLHALLNTNISLTIAYSEVTIYRPHFEEYLEYDREKSSTIMPPPEFLSEGIERIELLKRLPGNYSDGRPIYLVVFPSFNATRIGAVIEELSSSRVQWIFGIPHLVQNRWRIDAQRDYHKEYMQANHRYCFVSTFDYRETLYVLESIYNKRQKDYSILICSLGSKLQKVGEVLFHLLRPEVGVIVSIPRKWDPDKYSGEKVKDSYLLNLGDCKSLRQKLLQTKTLRI